MNHTTNSQLPTVTQQNIHVKYVTNAGCVTKVERSRWCLGREVGGGGGARHLISQTCSTDQSGVTAF